ncbi:hypothetical protein BC832DRAFT_152483 [Gaertneriomyces semiglobifer]|nr:hypothetical protein BC832DRAFT_152483 [Gaertneriomyces semiglobifer]
MITTSDNTKVHHHTLRRKSQIHAAGEMQLCRPSLGRGRAEYHSVVRTQSGPRPMSRCASPSKSSLLPSRIPDAHKDTRQYDVGDTAVPRCYNNARQRVLRLLRGISVWPSSDARMQPAVMDSLSVSPACNMWDLIRVGDGTSHCEAQRSIKSDGRNDGFQTYTGGC